MSNNNLFESSFQKVKNAVVPPCVPLADTLNCAIFPVMVRSRLMWKARIPIEKGNCENDFSTIMISPKNLTSLIENLDPSLIPPGLAKAKTNFEPLTGMIKPQNYTFEIIAGERTSVYMNPERATMFRKSYVQYLRDDECNFVAIETNYHPNREIIEERVIDILKAFLIK